MRAVVLQGTSTAMFELVQLAKSKGVEILIVEDIRTTPSLERLADRFRADRLRVALAEPPGDERAWMDLRRQVTAEQRTAIRARRVRFKPYKYGRNPPPALRRPRGALPGRFAFYQGAF